MKAKADTSQLFTRFSQLSAAGVNTTHHPDSDAEIDYWKSVSATTIPFSAYTLGHIQYEDSSASKDFSLPQNSSEAVEEYWPLSNDFNGPTQLSGYSYNSVPKYVSFEQSLTMRFRPQNGNGYPSIGNIGIAKDRSSVARTYSHRNAEDDRFRLAHLLLAISRVMARNVSHNIGSHVLSGLSNSESIKKLLSGINNPAKKEQQYRPLPQLAYNKEADSVDEAHLANLYSYLEVRMDFLADLTTGTHSLESSRMLLQEVMAGLDKNRILLNRISGIDDFGFRFVIRDCRHLSEGQSIDDAPEFTSATDIPVVMVNDIFGQHAFYVILENIIRNTAKHACIEKGTEVIFTIAISECAEDHTLYKCTIYDNCAPADTCLDELVVTMNNRLTQSFLKDDFTLREGALGLIEMAVSAAYLRKMKITDADSFETGRHDEYEEIAARQSQISILKAVKQGCCLGYELYLPKPQELLIIDENGQAWKDRFWQNGELDVAALKELESNGISYMHCLDDKEISAWRWAAEKSRSQQLLILISPINRRKYNYPSQRIITQAELEKYYAAYHLAGQNKTDDVPYIWDLLRANKGRQFVEEAWRCLIGKKMVEKSITGMSPHMNYSHFVAPVQHSGHILNVALDDHARNIKKAFGKNDFYQAFNHLTRDLIKNRVNPYINGRLKAQFDFRELFCFMESILTNVLIIDERIQKSFYSTMHAGIKKPIGFIAKKSFIYCPEPNEIDLSQQSFASDIRENLSAYLQKLFIEQKKLKGLDIVVIHLGLIEKIMKSEGQGKARKNIGDFIAYFKEEAEKIFGHEPCVIITSGRGKPENVPNNIPFLSYSILSQFLIDNQSKSLLTQALYSARPKI